MKAVGSSASATSAAASSASASTSGAEPGAASAADALFGASAAAPADGAPPASQGGATATNFRQLLSAAAHDPPLAAQLAQLVAAGREAAAGAAANDPTAVATATSAASLLSQLTARISRSSAAAGTDGTPSTDADAHVARTDDDGDDTSDADPLLLVLSALSQLGFAVQPAADVPAAASTATPSATDGKAPAAAAVPAGGAVGDVVARLLPSFKTALPHEPIATADGAAPRPRGSDASSSRSTLSTADGKLSALASALRLQLPAAAAADAPAREGQDRDRSQGQATDLSASGELGAGAVAAAANASPDTTPVTRTIALPVQHAGWSEAVASQIRMFAEQGVQRATLHLTPGHLGPVEVRLSLDKGQVDVNFSAASQETRTALEHSLPQLRDMLGGAGLSLGQAQVQQQMRQGSQNSFQPDGLAADTEGGETLSRASLRLGLVDEYA